MHSDTNSVIKEFHRYSDGSSKTKTVSNYKNYFFVDLECPLDKWDGVVKVETGFTSIENTPVKKVLVQKSDFVRTMCHRIEKIGYKHWEADIPYTNRYLIDLKEEIVPVEYKIFWFDIEVGSEDSSNERNPVISEANLPICSIAAIVGDKTVSWIYGKVVEGSRCFGSESDMLYDFLSFFYNESPDIISAWNLSGFDLPYLIKRCVYCGVDYSYLSKIRKVREREYNGEIEYNLLGTIQFDLLTGYKLWRKYGNFPLLESYSLDYVANSVLGEEKLKHGKSITWLWHNDPETLIKYNVRDVELMRRIDLTCKVVSFFDEVRRLAHVQFTDVYRTTSIIDGYLISRLNKSIILPSKNRNEGDVFKGADVYDPIPGIYENVICLDVASLYPSIIKTFNISYETVGGGEIILPLKNAISFSREVGVIPRFLDELRAERNKYKALYQGSVNESEKQLFYQRQYALKIIANSLFGYLGYPGSRLYKREVAASITGMGRYILTSIKNYIESLGNTVIYGDTDSNYVQANSSEPLEVIAEGEMIRKSVNVFLEGLSSRIAGQNFIFIEFEKILKRAVFTEAKKRYAYTLLWENGSFKTLSEGLVSDNKIRVQGFDMKRSDSSFVSKLAQRTVMTMILEGKSKKEVVTYLKELSASMKRGDFPDDQIGIPKAITKELHEYNPPQAITKAALFSNEFFDTDYGRGSKPKLVYIKDYRGIVPRITIRGKSYDINCIAYDTNMPEGFSVDWDKMLNNTLFKKLTKIFDAVNWEWEPLENTSLW